MLPTLNTLPEDVRGQSVDLLKMRLAAAIDLQARIKQAHWNVRGPGSTSIHALFDTIATFVEDYIDLLAERAAGLGATAHDTVQVATEQSFLASAPSMPPPIRNSISLRPPEFSPTSANLFARQSAGPPLWMIP